MKSCYKKTLLLPKSDYHNITCVCASYFINLMKENLMTTDNAINTGRKMQTEGNRRRIEPIIDTVIKVDGMDLHYMIIIEIIEFD